MMTASILLSTRLAIFEDMFGGLDRSYQVHRTAGVIASLFVSVHFFTSPKELPAGADPIANAMVPSSPKGMLAMIFLIIGLFMALNRKIRYSTWRPMHKFMALVYVMIIAHFMTASSVFVDHYSAFGLFLIVAAVLGVIAMPYSLFGMNRRTAVAYEIDQINPMERTTEIVLKAQKKWYRIQTRSVCIYRGTRKVLELATPLYNFQCTDSEPSAFHDKSIRRLDQKGARGT